MTGYNNTSKDAALTAIGAAASYISLHSADPGTTGANEISGGSYARVATTWGSSSGGSNTGSQVTINVPASTTIEYFGMSGSGRTVTEAKRDAGAKIERHGKWLARLGRGGEPAFDDVGSIDVEQASEPTAAVGDAGIGEGGFADRAGDQALGVDG